MTVAVFAVIFALNTADATATANDCGSGNHAADLVLAAGATNLLRGFVPSSLPRAASIGFDIRTYAFAAVATIGSDDLVHGSVAEPRFRTLVVAAFGFASLILALAGVHGVLSFAESRRSRKIGVRMALGGGIGDFDPATWLATVLIITITGGAACRVPARRASHVPPSIAMCE